MTEIRIDDRYIVWIFYKNHRGEFNWRKIIPHETTFRFASTEYYPVMQYVFDAYDYERAAVRTFAMKNVLQWKSTPPGVNDVQPVSKLVETGQESETPSSSRVCS